MQIESGRYYKTRDGRKALVCTVLDDSPFSSAAPEYPFSGWIANDVKETTWCKEGRKYSDLAVMGINSSDLVAEWRHPIKVEGWINIYASGAAGILHHSKYKADARAEPGRTACIFVSGTENVCP